MLNNLKVNSLKSTGRPYRVADVGGSCKGLGLNVSAAGHKSYVLCMRVKGIRKRWKIGDTSNTLLSEAREDGLSLRKQIEKGNDPRVHVQSKVANLKELCEGYTDHLRNKGTKSIVDIERIFRTDCELLHNNIANEIMPIEIADLIRIVVKRGSLNQANRVRAYLQAAFNWGMAADLDTTLEKNGNRFNITSNPVSPVPKPQKGTRALDRWLSETEIKQVWEALPKYCGPVAANSLHLMIATGQRTQEVLNIKWSDIEDDVWSMPTTKNGKPHEVVLNSTALSVIEKIKKVTGNCEVVFPQNRARKTSMNSNTLSNTCRRMCRAESIKPFTPRDLRRTFKSMALKHGMKKDLLDMVQNHAQNDVSSKHYVKYAFLPEKRIAAQQWDVIIKNILN